MDEMLEPQPEAFPCAPFQELLDALLAAEADEATTARWSEHRESCGSCRVGWSLLQSGIEDLRALSSRTRSSEVWTRIESQLVLVPADAELDPAMKEWFRVWSEQPLRADARRAWRRLDRQLAPRSAPRMPWGLVAASVALPLALLTANEQAVASVVATAPDFFSRWVEQAASGPWAPLMLPLGFVLFGGAVALASIPLLRRAMLEPRRSIGALA